MTLSQRPKVTIDTIHEIRLWRRAQDGKEWKADLEGQTGHSQPSLLWFKSSGFSDSSIQPFSSAFVTLYIFIQHQLYTRHHGRAVKRTRPAKGLTSFRVCAGVCVCVFTRLCTCAGGICEALCLCFFMECLTTWMPVLCDSWVHVFLGCFPFLHGYFSFCILVSS